MALFIDRKDAGQQLATQLQEYANRNDVVVLGLARGGLPVAFEIAKQLHASLDVLIVRKLGVPGQEELAMGAIASGGVKVLNPDIIRQLGISSEEIDAVAKVETKELERRQQLYRGNRPLPNLKNKIVILVDDGLATGATMRAAVLAVQQQNPKQVIIAVPVAAYDTFLTFKRNVAEIICLATPEPFYGIGQWYDNFSQTSDSEVTLLLNQAEQWHGK